MERSGPEAMDRSDPLAALRGEFDELDGAIYMDGNSLGRPPRAVRLALAAAVDEWATDLVGGWHRWIDLPFAVGDHLGSVLGAGPGQVVVCDTTTVNFYKAVWAALDGRPGRRRVVADADDFPTDRYVLQGVAARAGLDLHWIRGDRNLGIDLDRLEAAVDDNTAVVCLSQVHFRSGARLDIGAATEIAHRRGALIIWDLCHSGGAVPVGLDDAGVDLAVGCTYKYLNAGPGAPGYIYVARHVQADLRQPIWGWFGQERQFEMGADYEPVVGVGRYLTGTPPILGLRAVDAAVGVIELAGIDRLWAKSVELTAIMTELISERLEPLGAELASPRDPSRRGAHVAVSHPMAWPWCAELIDRRLVVGDFRPPDVVRLGAAPLYTRYVDAYDAVERMEGVLREGLPDRPSPTRVT